MTLACSLVALVLAGSPAGGRHLETTLQDDALMLHSAPGMVQQVARRIADLGADRVRITAGWSALAPDPLTRKRPAPPFDATDSSSYPPEPWLRLDRAVKAARAAGLGVQLDVAFWAPRWAVERKSARDPDRPRWAPDPREFGRFAGAVAQRYDGSFPDPEHPTTPLPAVRLYTTWNEPNNPTFLEPQWIRRGGRWQAESPHVYRAMHEAAYSAIKAVSGQDEVLVGGTRSTGSSTPGKGGVPPLRFLRELTCVGDNLQPLAIPECNGYRPLRADGYAHHPYGLDATPGTTAPSGDDARLADSPRLEGLLAELAATGRLAHPLALYDTEYGYETNPPDPFAAFSPERQAQFIGWSTYLAWRDPQTRMFAQFLLQDQAPGEGEADRPATAPRRATRRSSPRRRRGATRRSNARRRRGATRRPGSRRRRGAIRRRQRPRPATPLDPAAAARRPWIGFQSGLLYADGTPKPAALAFRLPFWAESDVVGGEQVVRLFGGVRPDGAGQWVRVERQDPGGGAWTPVPVAGSDTCDGATNFRTDAGGWFLRAAAYTGPASYRLSRLRPDGSWESGVEIPVGPPPTPPVPPAN